MNLQDGLNKAIHYLEERIRDRLDGGRYPSGDDKYRPNYVPIQDSVIISEAESVSDGYQARLTYGGEDAPYALAYEFGSGERAGEGTYEIFAVNVGALSFYWEKIGAQTIVPKKGGFTSHYASPNVFFVGKGKVDHPGIKAQPFVEPTIQEEKEKIGEIIGKDFVAQIGVMFEKEFQERITIEVSI